MKHLFLAAAAFACALSSSPASAQSQAQQWTYCANEGSAFAPDLVIGACTALIQSGRQTPNAVANAFYNRGTAYKNSPQPDYARAIADYTQAIALNPRDADFFNMRGLTYEYSAPPDYARAMADFNQAIALNPKLRQAFSNRGNVYQEMPQPDYARAITEYDQAIAADPQYAPAFNNRGIAYRNGPQPDFDRAIADFTKAIVLDPRDASYFSHRGHAYEDRPEPDYARAIADFDQAGVLDANDASYQNSRCWARALANRELDVARSACDAAIRLSTDYASALDSRGLVGLKQGRNLDAWNDYDDAVRLNAESASYVFGRGVAALRLWRIPQGLSDLSRAKALDTKIAETYAGYGVKPPISDGPVTYMILGGLAVGALLALGFLVFALVKRFGRKGESAPVETAAPEEESSAKSKGKLVPLLVLGGVAAAALAAFVFWPRAHAPDAELGGAASTETAAAGEPAPCSPAPLPSMPLDQRIAACTEIIKSGRVQGADLSETYYFRGLLHVRGETPNRPAAIADYDEAIRLNPQDPRAHQSRASSYIILKDYDRAITGANEAIKLTDTNEEGSFGPFVTLGNAYYAKGDYKQAIATYNQVIEIADGREFTKTFGQAQGFYGRGVAELKLGENAKGQADIAKAKTLFPNVENMFAVFGMTPPGSGSPSPASAAASTPPAKAAAAAAQPPASAPPAAVKPAYLGEVRAKFLDASYYPDWARYSPNPSDRPALVISRPSMPDRTLFLVAVNCANSSRIVACAQAPTGVAYAVRYTDEAGADKVEFCPEVDRPQSCDPVWREKGADIIALARAIHPPR